MAARQVRATATVRRPRPNDTAPIRSPLAGVLTCGAWPAPGGVGTALGAGTTGTGAWAGTGTGATVVVGDGGPTGVVDPSGDGAADVPS